jgi:hypothetical protein
VGLSALVQPESEDLLEGLDLFAGSEGLGPFDAVLAVMARRKGWLVSADRSFGQVGGLVHLAPIPFS